MVETKSIYFVSGHDGAVEWARRRGIEAVVIRHLDPDLIAAGDEVIGTLPVNLIAAICAKGAHYFHLTLDLPAQARQKPLSADEMDAYGARLEAYEARKL